MSRDHTSAGMIESIKRIGSIPTSQNLFKTADFLGFINSEMENLVVPLIIAHHEDYFVKYVDITVVGGTDTYDLPAASIGLGLREAAYVDENGSLRSLERLTLSKVSGENYNISNGFYFLGNDIVLYPKPTSGKTLRLFYHRDPNEVVATDSCGQITAIDTGASTITLSTVPTSWVTNSTIDVIEKDPGFDTLATGLTISNIAANVLTVSTVEGLAIGNWVALEGFSPIAQIPKNSLKIVNQAVAVKCREAMGKSIKDAEGKLQQYIESFSKTIAPRSKGKAKVITANGEGLYKVGLNTFGRGRGRFR